MDNQVIYLNYSNNKLGVGKSSILLRFVTGDFKEDCPETLGASFMSKIFIHEGNLIKYQVKFFSNVLFILRFGILLGKKNMSL